ncbi:hypothetical protein CMI47_14995 [Candidatus Pacearchaeota archaeon]|jgi:uncharacterized coiled-coil protein SlyX|nr:hypothetical protein [Candidatus Pacearchaeota archaeon]
MGLKITLIMIVIMGVITAGFYWYYRDSQAKIAVLNENNAKLEIAVATQEQAIGQLRSDIKLTGKIIEETNRSLAAARKQVTETEYKFNKTSKLLGERDIGRIALAKPGPVQKIINNGTLDMFRCFEIISGSPLTEKEVNVEKKSKANTSCPSIANPNYILPN